VHGYGWCGLFFSWKRSQVSLLPRLLQKLKTASRRIWNDGLFTLDDNEDDPKFLSGERIESATDMFRDGPLKANAIIFNCAPPEICLPAMDTLAAQNFPGEIGVSPNAFAEKRHSYGAGDKAHIVREDMTPAAFAAMAETFQRKGATIMGGCCGAGPQHLQGMVDFFRLQGLALAGDEPHWTELAQERIQIRSDKIAAL